MGFPWISGCILYGLIWENDIIYSWYIWSWRFLAGKMKYKWWIFHCYVWYQRVFENMSKQSQTEYPRIWIWRIVDGFEDCDCKTFCCFWGQRQPQHLTFCRCSHVRCRCSLRLGRGVTTNPLGSSRWAIEISHGRLKNSRRSGRLKWSCCTCDHGSSDSQINIIVRTEVGSTLQNQEWRLKTKKRGINVSFESQSWCAAQLFFQMLTCPCWYQEFMARKHDSL